MEINRYSQVLQSSIGQSYSLPVSSTQTVSGGTGSVTQPTVEGDKVTLSPESIRLLNLSKDGIVTPLSGGGGALPPWPPTEAPPTFPGD